MNGISHAATALIITRRWPTVPIIPILISVQLVDLIWVVLTLIGIESVHIKENVRSIADVHFEFMPYSHSLFSNVCLAGLVWFVVSKVFNKPAWGLALAIGVISHIILDVATHARDIEVFPVLIHYQIGSGAYSVPFVAFIIELLYCILCWRIFRGNKFALFCLVTLNLLGVSFYFTEISGPEFLITKFPDMFILFIGGQALLGAIVVWWLVKLSKKSDEA